MTGKLLASFLIALGLVAGGLMYYLQVFAYYDRLELADGAITLVPLSTGTPEPIPSTAIRAIDADSSPIRFRACFETPLTASEASQTYEPAPDAEPLNAPFWFDCFDAAGIGDAVEEGTVIAFLSEKNIAYGVDRIVALTDEGRAFAWHQLNDCGELAYDGTPVGEACPEREEGE